MIADMYNVLKALGASVDVSLANSDDIPTLNPEFMLSESIVIHMNDNEDKLKAHNEQIEILIQENKALKVLVNNLLTGPKEQFASVIGETPDHTISGGGFASAAAAAAASATAYAAAATSGNHYLLWS